MLQRSGHHYVTCTAFTLHLVWEHDTGRIGLPNIIPCVFVLVLLFIADYSDDVCLHV